MFDGGGQLWRIFTGGPAGPDGIMMRGPFPDVLIPGGSGRLGWVHVAWVYSASAGDIKGYLNGVEVVTVSVGTLSLAPTLPLKIGSFNGISALDDVMLEDFRFSESVVGPALFQHWVAESIGGAVSPSGASPTIGGHSPFFDSVDRTGVVVIPASALDRDLPVIDDVCVAGLSDGTWVGDATIAIGHLSQSGASPFLFPGPHGSTPGSFSELQTIVDGSFSFECRQDSWCPLGLNAGFRWNGADDVGLYVTYQNAGGSTISGVRHASLSQSFLWTAGYEAPSGVSMAIAPRLRVLQSPEPETTEEHVPSQNAFGASNTVPFGSLFSSAMTYMARVPASYMDAERTVVDGIAVLPTGSGTWSSQNVTIRLGHVQNPVPCPFNFTTDLLDAKTVHRGPLLWQAVTDTWCRLGFSSDTFEWNGIDDVGVYLTFANATVTGWDGGCWAAGSGIPKRTYHPNLSNATATNLCDEATGGIKLRLDLREPAEPFSTTVLHLGSGAASQEINGLPDTALQGWTVATFTPASPVGSGPMFGIIPDGVSWFILTTYDHPTLGHPFHWTANGSTAFYPHVPIVVPPGVMSAFAGNTWQYVSVALGPGLGLQAFSNVTEVTW